MESALRQFADTPPTTKSSPTPAPVATLSSSPCVRDVCDAIIVHALRQHDVTPTETSSPSLSVSAHSNSHESQSCMTDSDTHVTDSKSHLTDHINPYSALQLAQSKSCFIESNNPQQSSHMTDSSSSRFTDSGLSGKKSPSRLTDSKPHSTDSPSCATYDDSQPHSADLKTNQSESKVTDSQSSNEQSESCMSDFPSRMTESNSGLSDSHVEQIPSTVVVTGTTTTTTTTTTADGDSDGEGMKRSEVDLPGHEADDVDMEEQPLCIDLNRDTSPDDDTVGD